jgi:hypothetical protein
MDIFVKIQKELVLMELKWYFEEMICQGRRYDRDSGVCKMTQ